MARTFTTRDEADAEATKMNAARKSARIEYGAIENLVFVDGKYVCHGYMVGEFSND